MTVEICACICTVNRAQGLIDSFTSLLTQSVDKSQVELLIVDNGSDAHDPQALAETLVSRAEEEGFSARYIFEPIKGLSHARNAALAQSSANWIAFMDDDEIACPNWLGDYLSAIHRHPNNGNLACLGGPMELIWPNNRQPIWHSQHLEGYFSGLDYGTKTRFLDPRKEALFGGNFVVNRQAALNVGMFTSSLGKSGSSNTSFLVGEDTAMQLKLALDGKKTLYVPSAHIGHLVLPNRLEESWVLARAFSQGKSGVKIRHELYGHGRARQALSVVKKYFSSRFYLKTLSQTLNNEQSEILGKTYLARLKGAISGLTSKL